MIWQVVQTLYKSTFDETSIVRRVVNIDAVVAVKDLLPTVETQGIMAKFSQNHINGGCGVAFDSKYMLQNLPVQLFC